MAKVAPLNPTSVSTGTCSPTLQQSENGTNELMHFRNYVNRKACYHPAAVEEARITERKKKIAFQIKIWTLLEKRQVEWYDKPDDGKPVAGEDVGDLFDKKYKYDAPETELKQTEPFTDSLNNTRKKEVCPSCAGKGVKACYLCSGTGKRFGRDCLACKGQGSPSCTRCSKTGYIIRWARMKIEWRTVDSVDYHQNTFLPNKYFERDTKKKTVFKGDDECQNHSLEDTFRNLLPEVAKIPGLDFSAFIKKMFEENHIQKVEKSTMIRRIKCLIQTIDVTEISYQSGTLTNPHSDEGKYTCDRLASCSWLSTYVNMIVYPLQVGMCSNFSYLTNKVTMILTYTKRIIPCILVVAWVLHAHRHPEPAQSPSWYDTSTTLNRL